ncbi:protein-tyrosine phosphatase family protein [Maridesulfovibrio sp.]|uniref:protein-tyrosine phosphatase family protein n=1 Tax=Maridesulfovibrio sp. TaxID=2795000 RepID=UPI0039EF486C
MVYFQKARGISLVAILFLTALFIANVPQVSAESFRITLPGNTYDSFKDYTDVTIWKLENGKIDNATKEFFGGNQPPSDNATTMEVNASYLIQLTSGKMGQNFNCTVNTKSGYTWDIDSSCSSPYNTRGCLGCQYLQAPAGDNYFHALPITHVNPSEQNYWQAYLLDKNGKNLLFRGPNPTLVKNSKESFDFPGLLKALKNRYKIQVGDGNFPDNFIFVDISLINSDLTQPPSTGNPTNGYVLNAEYRFFDSQITNSTAIPPKNSYVNGTVELPASNSSANAKTINGALLWWEIQPIATDSETLGQLVTKIGSLLDSKNSVPYLIYIHCISGCDRTGDVAVAHLLNYRKMNPVDAYNYGTTVFDINDAQHRLAPHSTWRAPLTQFCLNSTQSGENLCQTGCDFPAPAQFPPKNVFPWANATWGCGLNGQ